MAFDFKKEYKEFYMNYLGYGKRWALHFWLRLSAWLALL